MIAFQGRNLKKMQFKQADGFEIVSNKGKLELKRLTFSNYIPPENITDDNDVSISVADMKWFPKSIPKKDKLSLNNGYQFFKKNAWKKTTRHYQQQARKN